MKKNFYAAILLSLLTFPRILHAQNQVLIKSIEYDVPIVNKDLCQGSELSETDWWKRNIETAKRWYFQQALINKAISGEIKVYDENENELSIAAITKIVSFMDTVMIQRTKPPYNYHDTVYTKYISPSEIHSIRFRETWYYNPKTFQILKEISSYSPLIAVEQTVKFQNKTKTVSKNTPLFWVKCSSSDRKTITTLTDYIQYNCPVYYNMQVAMPQFGNLVNVSKDTTIRKSYMESLINAVLDQNVKICGITDFSDYYDFTIDSIIPLTDSEIKSVAGSTDTITVTKPNPPYDMFDTVIYKVMEIKNLSMLRFYEKWLIDPKTMELQKEVMALSPCKEVKSSDGYFKGVRPLFTVMFEKAVRCFKE